MPLISGRHGVRRAGDRVFRAVNRDVQGPRPVGPVGCGAVQQARVHQAYRARRTGAEAGGRAARCRNVVRHRPREYAIVPQAVDRAAVRRGKDLQGSVRFGDFVHHQQGRHHIVVGVWREREILVPLHLGVPARQLRIDLSVVQLDVGADEVGDAIDHPAVRRRREIGVRDFDRRVDPAQLRRLCAVPGLQVEARSPVERVAPGGGVAAALFHPRLEVPLQPRQQGGVDRVFDHQIAVLVEKRTLVGAELGHGRRLNAGRRPGRCRAARARCRACAGPPGPRS